MQADKPAANLASDPTEDLIYLQARSHPAPAPLETPFFFAMPRNRCCPRRCLRLPKQLPASLIS